MEGGNLNFIAMVAAVGFWIAADNVTSGQFPLTTFALGGVLYFMILLFTKDELNKIGSQSSRPKKIVISEIYIPFLIVVAIISFFQYRGGFDTPYFFAEYNHLYTLESKFVWLLIFASLAYCLFWLLVRGGLDILIDIETANLPVGSRRVSRSKKFFDCIKYFFLFICGHSVGSRRVSRSKKFFDCIKYFFLFICGHFLIYLMLNVI